MSRVTVYDRIPTSYREALAMLNGRDSVSLGYETLLLRHTEGVALRHHRTNIVGYCRDGRFLLDADGYRSSTTKRRMNAALRGTGYAVVQRNFQWLIVRTSDGAEREYRDHSEIRPVAA